MKSTGIGTMTIVFLAVLSAAAHAQNLPSPARDAVQPQKTERQATHPEHDRRQVVPFLDGTYVGLSRSRSTLRGVKQEQEWTFDGDIVPNFVIHQTFFDVISEEDVKVNQTNLTAAAGMPDEDPEYRFAWSVVGVPMVRLRMFVNDVSSPVRTPSFMPKGTVQAFWFKLGENDRLNLLNAQATVGHHSNGQDGCLYIGQTRNESLPDRPCEPDVTVDRTFRSINRDDGSFSTNYLQLGFRYRNIVLDPPATVTDGSPAQDRTSRRDATIGVDFELNPTEFLGGAGINDDLRTQYGGNRVTVLAGMAWRKGCTRLETKGFIKHIFKTGEGVPGWAGSVEVQCLLGSSNWGPFVRYFAGQDYYNLAFQDNAKRLQFGMTYSQEGFLRFRPGRDD